MVSALSGVGATTRRSKDDEKRSRRNMGLGLGRGGGEDAEAEGGRRGLGGMRL